MRIMYILFACVYIHICIHVTRSNIRDVKNRMPRLWPVYGVGAEGT